MRPRAGSEDPAYVRLVRTLLDAPADPPVPDIAPFRPQLRVLLLEFGHVVALIPGQLHDGFQLFRHAALVVLGNGAVHAILLGAFEWLDAIELRGIETEDLSSRLTRSVARRIGELSGDYNA